MRSLPGSCIDVKSVQTLLRDGKAEPTRIKILRNEGATRDNILRELAALADNSEIKENDPILIYFAGHGTEAAYPQGWPGKGEWAHNIQMFCPYDFVPKYNEEKSTQGIQDVILAAYLNHISEAKGNNIASIPILSALRRNRWNADYVLIQRPLSRIVATPDQ